MMFLYAASLLVVGLGVAMIVGGGASYYPREGQETAASGLWLAGIGLAVFVMLVVWHFVG